MMSPLGSMGPMGPAVPSLPGAPPSGLASDPRYFNLNERQRKLIEYLKAYGSIRNRDYYEYMNVSKSTGGSCWTSA